MCYMSSPEGNLAVRAVVLTFALINFILLIVALAVPYVSVKPSGGRRVHITFYHSKTDGLDGTNHREPADYEVACLSFEIIAVILCFVTVVLMAMLTAIQAKWNAGVAMWLNHERGMASAVLAFSVFIFIFAVIALGLCAFAVNGFRVDYFPTGKVEAGLIVLVPVVVLSFVNFVLVCAGSCFGVSYCDGTCCCCGGVVDKASRGHRTVIVRRGAAKVNPMTGYPIATPVNADGVEVVQRGTVDPREDQRNDGVYITIDRNRQAPKDDDDDDNDVYYYRGTYQDASRKQANYV